ncbi:MAG: Hsp70 family protein [Rectinemataceae bacterium]|jgi:cell division septation protein DedD
MTTNNIGLKLADGEFYPVLEDGTVARKRLVVTTVQDGQPSVQIDLYRGQGPTVENAVYIGSLVVEGIPKMAKGEPDIRMDLGLAKDGILTAFAQEASTGASQSLKVSLEALPEEEKYEVPDFEFSKEADDSSISDFSEGDFEGTDSLPPEADSAQLLADVRSEADAEEAKEKPKSKTLGIILAAIGILLVLLIIGFLVYRFLIVPRSEAKVEPAQTVAAAQTPTPAPTSAPAPAPAKIEPPAPEPVATAEAPKAPEPEKKAVTFKKPGVTYKIKWGDTLWDLSYSYYRDPWVYMRIARANKIKNPDLIICGNKIWIPAKK